MLRVTLRGSGMSAVTLGSGETLLFGRSSQAYLPVEDPQAALRFQAVDVPQCAAHVSRLLGELVVGDEVIRLRWRGTTEAQLSSLFDAPGGARRVILTNGMTALLDEGENSIVVLRGRPTAAPSRPAVMALDPSMAYPMTTVPRPVSGRPRWHGTPEPPSPGSGRGT